MGSTGKSVEKVIVIADNLPKNISILMEKNGISESDLARALNIPYNTIRRLASGFTTDPRMSTLKLIANYFNIGLDALTGEGDPTSYALAANQSPRSVPILGWSDISDSTFMHNINLSSWASWQPIALASTEDLSEQAYALTSRRSMGPRFPLGTVFIIDPDKSPIDGDLVLVKIKESHAVSLRDLIIDPPNWQLLPIIEHSPALLYDESKHKIIGIIVLTMLRTRRS